MLSELDETEDEDEYEGEDEDEGEDWRGMTGAGAVGDSRPRVRVEVVGSSRPRVGAEVSSWSWAFGQKAKGRPRRAALFAAVWKDRLST